MAAIRFSFALALALLLNLSLFTLLSRMTHVHATAGDSTIATKIEFVRLRREVEVEEKKREKPQRVKPEQAPVVPTMSVAKDEGVNLELDVQAIAAGLGAEFGSAAGGGGDGSGVPGGISFGGGQLDRAPLPLVRVEPLYPPQAAKRGLEGWVQLRFTISTAGSVTNASVVKSSNPVFNRPALEAVAKWKYEPQMQAGKAVDTPGVDVVLRFKMES